LRVSTFPKLRPEGSSEGDSAAVQLGHTLARIILDQVNATK